MGCRMNFDKEMQPYLRAIKQRADECGMRARWITDDCNELVNMPGWETQAEEALSEAEHQLRRAALTVQQALLLLAKKRPAIAAE